jgi:hypothetical protein
MLKYPNNANSSFSLCAGMGGAFFEFINPLVTADSVAMPRSWKSPESLRYRVFDKLSWTRLNLVHVLSRHK